MKLITVKPFKGGAYGSWGLPKEIQSTQENRISAKFEQGTADTLRGLTFEEEKEYLPNIIGVSPTDHTWSERTREYWANMSILVPDEGLVLNIDTFPEGHPKAGKPENLAHYITYRFILKDHTVAKNKNLLEWPKQKFYIVDELVIKKESEASFEQRTRAMKGFMFLQSEKGAHKIEWVALCLKEAGDIVPKGTIEMLMFIEGKKDAPADKKGKTGIDKFLEVINDENLEHKALLYKYLSLGVIERNGNSYFFGGEVMGNETEAVHWLKNPANSKSLLQMNERVKATIV